MITTRSGSFSIKESVIAVSLSLVAVLSVIAYTGHLPDGQIMFKWLSAGIAFCTTVIITRILSVCTFTGADAGGNAYSIRTIAIPFLMAGLIVVIHSLIQMTGVASAHYPDGFRVLAGFDNPAGVASALAVSFPFVIALADRLKERWIRYTVMGAAFCGVIMILAVSRSRAGILAVGVVILLWVIHTIKDAKTRRIAAAILAVLVTAVVVYMSFHKRGSNSGRALILGVCWDMFKDAPLTGHGLHGFRSWYMLYQAEYLDRCASRVLPMLADNITHPLNEYALVAVNFGMSGLIILMIGVVITIRHYLGNQSEESFVGMTVLAGIGVLSMFSYPFRYPLTVLGVLCALLLVYRDTIMHLSVRTRALSSAVTVMMSVAGLVLIIPWARAQTIWGRLSYMSDSGGYNKEVLEGYHKLYPKLSKDPYFLYNYAYVLSENGEHQEAERFATESFNLMSNYDTALFLADNAKECGILDIAEEYYKLASRMCPVRFVPLYGLFCLYENMGRKDEMREIGEKILTKPVKVHSMDVRQIIRDVQMKLLINN